MIIEQLCGILDTVVQNWFRMGAEPKDVLETLTWWYANACNALHTMIPDKEGEVYAEAGKSEIRAGDDELGQSGQPVDDAG